MSTLSYTKGYVTLMSVLVVGAIAISVTLTLLIIGTSAGQTSFSFEQGTRARQLAHGCVESALLTIAGNTNYTGTATVDPAGLGTCSYTVTNTGGTARRIDTQATSTDAHIRVQAILSDVNPITVSSWQEVASF